MQSRSDDPTRTDFWRIVPPSSPVSGHRLINGQWWSEYRGIHGVMDCLLTKYPQPLEP